MRSKLFCGFLAVIILALFSDVLFEKLIIRDFGEYGKSEQQDHVYWLITAVESSYTSQGWNRQALTDALQWAVMLRFDCSIQDESGKAIMDTDSVIRGLSDSMRRRLQIAGPEVKTATPYDSYPLFHRGQEIGSFNIKDMAGKNLSLRKKEHAFRERGRAFLLLSFSLAGGSAFFMALILSQFFSRPISELKKASEAVAKGDLSVRLETGTDEIGRLKAAFNRMAEALQREDALRKHLTSNVAHELRTPLAIMKARVEAMLDGVLTASPEEFEPLLAELDTLTRLIGGIEDLTKAEASFLKVNMEEVCLHDFLRGVTDSLAPVFKDKGLSLQLASKGEFVVQMDVEKLEKTVRNILVNAKNHTETGGVFVDYGIEGGKYFIEIKDTGKGIAEKDLPHIFQRFYRSGGSKGFGLGLAIAKELLATMDGDISVSSKQGEGSAFKLSVPLNQTA
ncbi:MAG: HAMP domain-containing sensor histidine kinase [Actinomycetota bacterium]|nr:HAMP domain-containing sensor histidine kinase [Actinomycetota bacterium]